MSCELAAVDTCRRAVRSAVAVQLKPRTRVVSRPGGEPPAGRRRR
jgi:hypothetical protein